MTIEIISATITSRHSIEITAIDCSEEHLQKMERLREDSFERKIQYCFDTVSEPKSFYALRKWMQKQKVTSKAATWGEALQAIEGIVTDSYGIGRYRVVD